MMPTQNWTPRAGTLFLVVGGSGVGKDTLIDAARRRFAGDQGIVFPRRVITRAENSGEDHASLDRKAFETARGNGAFALHWEAHGLSYGVPAAIGDDLTSGRSVVVNVSRRVIGHAEAVFSPVVVLNIVAPDTVRASRLAARGRETAEDIAARISREAPVAVATAALVDIDNGGALEVAIRRFCDRIAAVSQGAAENAR